MVLRAANKIQAVNIYNILEQEVMNITPNTATPNINMDGLQAGTYLMKVSIDGNEKTYRLLKK